jgi:hypothetical protein
LDNKPLYPKVSKVKLGTYVVMDEHDEPIASTKPISETLSYGVWTMHFDGAQSISRVGALVVFASPLGNIFIFLLSLEFDCTNNMVKYEALLLGIE